MKTTFQPVTRTRIKKGRAGAAMGPAFALIILFSSIGSGSSIVAASKPGGGANAPEASCPAGQCFADVPPSNPFYEFANRIYNQGLVSGYTCGGPGEACDAENRPYYRPGSAVTRQQMAKFIDNARRMSEIHIDASTADAPLWASNSSGDAVYGQAMEANGVYGKATGSTINAVGVRGEGVLGVQGTSATGEGVTGSTSAADRSGVSGYSTGSNGVGVFGEANTGANAEGVHGQSSNGFGVVGSTGGTGKFGVYGYGNANSGGVRGETNANITAAVQGVSYGAPGVGVFGMADTSTSGTLATGVFGTSATGSGVVATSGGTNAALGAYATGSGSGIYAQASQAGSPGVWGDNTVAGGLAGYFSGNVQVTGNLSKGGGSFKIDHPLDPENKYLYHSFVESPDMMNIYNGNVTTDAKGEATITMPDWFDALNRDFRYQLTPIGQFAQVIVWQEMKGNTFVIKSDKPNVKVSWLVTGIRHDPYANEHRIPVEEDKRGDEKGKYLYPTEWGKPESSGIDYGKHSELLLPDRAQVEGK